MADDLGERSEPATQRRKTEARKEYQGLEPDTVYVEANATSTCASGR